MKKPVKWALFVVVAAIAAGVVYYTLTAPMAVEAVVAAPETAQIYFTGQGVKSYGRLYQLSPLVSGRIETIYLSEGDTVAPGQTLLTVAAEDIGYQIEQLQAAQRGHEATIRSYEAQKDEVVSQEAQYKQSLRDNLAALEGEMKSIRGQRYSNRYEEDAMETYIDAARLIVRNNEQAVREYEALLAFYREAYNDPGATPEERAQYLQEMLYAQEKLATAESALKSSMNDLNKLQNGDLISDIYYEGLVQTATAQENAIKARLAEDYTDAMIGYYDALIDATESQIAMVDSQMAQLRSQSGNFTLTCPVGGTLVSLPAGDTNLAVSGQPAAIIGIGSAVEVYVPLREIGGVFLGQSVDITLEGSGGDRHFAGRVTEIDDKAELRLSALGVEERRVRVLVDTDADLGMGYAVDVKFVTYEEADAIVLPKTAIFTDGEGRDCVFVIAQGVAVKTVIETGVDTRAGRVVTAGVAPGDVVIRDTNQTGLAEGKAVEAV